MIIDMSQYLATKQEITFKAHLQNLNKDLDNYLDIKRNPTYINSGKLRLLQFKLVQMNYLIDPENSHKYFIDNIYGSTIGMALVICEYEIGDIQYTAMRECFLKMDQDINYLLSTDSPLRNKFKQNINAFTDLINSLKMIQAMKDLQFYTNKNQEDIAIQKIKLIPEQLKESLQQSFIYNVILDHTTKGSKVKLNYIYKLQTERKLQYDSNLVNGTIDYTLISDIIYDSLIELDIHSTSKYKIVELVLKQLNYIDLQLL